MKKRGPGRGASSAPATPSLFGVDAEAELLPAAPATPVREADPGAVPATAITVATLSAVTRDIVEGAFPPVWVRGEVVDFREQRRGHWYFSLKDDEAQVRCVVWASDRVRFMVAPDEGMEVVVRGRLTVYAAKSELQLRVTRIESVGDGLWRKQFEQTRTRLAADGLLDADRKRELPWFPRRIGIITSTHGAALQDVIAVVRRRCPVTEIVLIPAVVQGDDAPRSLCAALKRLKRCPELDLVILGRGGGAREDLWAFNDERVARALAACPVPTIAAIGHEVDVTLCDLVADARAATPSAAAELAVPVLADVRDRVLALGRELQHAASHVVFQSARRASNTALAMARSSENILALRRTGLEGVAARLHALSPLGTLGRGFALATDNDGRPISSVQRLRIGDQFGLRLRDGELTARVDDIQPLPESGL